MRRLAVTVAIATVCSVTGLATPGAATPAGASAPPRAEGTIGGGFTGFTDTSVASVSGPTTVVGLPDGRAVMLEKQGRVRIIRDGVLLGTPALSMTGEVCSNSERGMLGFATDPDFGANRIVYLYYTRYSASAPGGCVNRVSRFTMNGDTIPRNSEVVLLDNIGSPAGNHNGGDIEIGNDGYLYVAVGDGGCNPRDPIAGTGDCAGGNTAAQDLSLLNGKILRLDRLTGAPAPGNPISGPGTTACASRGNTPTTPATWCREIFAWGLRNPWRFAFDPNTGATRFYINDVGQNTREEVNEGAWGANYGWPEREGFCAQGANTPCAGPDPGDNYTQPITDYSHNNARSDFGGEYVTGGAFVPDGAWPAEFDGGYLFADGNPGRIFLRPKVLPPNPLAVYSNPFVTGVGGVSDIGFVFENTGWSLYYVNSATGEVRRVRPTQTAAPDSDLLHYAPIDPERAYDSRDAGAESGRVRAGTSRLVNLVDGQGTHRAALVNLTYIRPQSNGWVVAWQPRTLRPASSNINGQTDQVAANASVVPIDADGNLVLYNSTTAHLVVDVLGFFDTGATPTAGRLSPMDPERAVDTRNAPGVGNDYSESSTPDGTVIQVPLENTFVPTGTSAVALIVTAISPAGPGAGYVVAHPAGSPLPVVSHVNVSGSNDRRANLVIVPLAEGTVELLLHGVQDVVVDVVGTFTGSGATPSSVGQYRLIAPGRAVDTRLNQPFGRLAAGGTGTAGPSMVPANALAVTQNIVVVNTSAIGYGTTYPANLVTVPLVSNVNASGAGQVRAAMALTRLSPSGELAYYTSMGTDLVVDVTGYFVQPSS